MNRRSLSRIAGLLERQWGPFRQKPLRPPLDELILTLLSQNTSDLNSGRAFRSLRRRIPGWDAVRRAPLQEIEEAIQVGGLAHTKARRIQAILEGIYRERKHLGLSFLRRLSDREASDYLMGFKGVGPKTAACVMLFSLGRAAFPVDTHIHRIIRRLEGKEERWGPEEMQEELQRAIPPELMYSLHLHLVHHGRKICGPRRPLCDACLLLALCAHGRAIQRSRASVQAP